MMKSFAQEIMQSLKLDQLFRVAAEYFGNLAKSILQG